jgi:hypothetical protein
VLEVAVDDDAEIVGTDVEMLGILALGILGALNDGFVIVGILPKNGIAL